jgi:hypothetical protein
MHGAQHANPTVHARHKHTGKVAAAGVGAFLQCHMATIQSAITLYPWPFYLVVRPRFRPCCPFPSLLDKTLT